jgi:hypothetical protein
MVHIPSNLMKTPFLPLPLRSLATTAACALLTASALAQVPAPGTPAPPAVPGSTPPAPAATPAPKPLNASEKNFIKSSGKSMHYLIQVATAGKTRVTDEKLTRFRDKTISDLNKAWSGLSKFATSRGETLAAELSGADKTDVERLAKLKDDKFVKQWIEDMAKEAKKLDKDFESAGRTMQDPDMKTFVGNYTPIVRTIFTAAEAAEKGLKK